jgi:hypothetical protein
MTATSLMLTIGITRTRASATRDLAYREHVANQDPA